MGFELNRIMKQYGVGTPGRINYSGAAAPAIPVEPKAPPVGSDDATSGLYPGAQTKYQADLAAYPELLAKYNADKDTYENYTRDYQNRLQNTPMYLQSQFDTSAQPQTYTPATTIEGLYNQYLKRAPDAEGLAFWKKGFGEN